jgi:hypothetical protein
MPKTSRKLELFGGEKYLLKQGEPLPPVGDKATCAGYRGNFKRKKKQ